MITENLLLFASWTLNSSQVVTGIGAIAAGAIGITLGMRWYVSHRAQQLKNNGTVLDSTLERKHRDIEIHQYTGTFRLVGAICATALCGILLAWTQWDSDNNLAMGALETPEELLIDPPMVPPMPPKTPTPPPPKPPTDQFVVEDNVIEKLPEDNRPEDPLPNPNPGTGTEFTNNTTITTPIKPRIVEPEPTPLIPEKDDIVLIPEQMPRFPSTCENDAKMSNDNKKLCADKALLEYIYKNIKYPTIAVEAGAEGMAVIGFVVGKDGSIQNIEIMKDPGYGMGKEAARVVAKMNDLKIVWTPGKQNGRAVRVKYTLPVRFKLEK